MFGPACRDGLLAKLYLPEYQTLAECVTASGEVTYLVADIPVDEGSVSEITVGSNVPVEPG